MNTNICKKTTAFILTVAMVMIVLLGIPGISVHAATTGTIVNVNTAVNMRSRASTKSSRVIEVPKGTTVTINDTVVHDSDDTSGYISWYNVTVTLNSRNYTGYIASNYVQKNTTVPSAPSDSNFESQINAFPESYKPYLRSLHALHPNWVFHAINTGVQWATALDLETSNGKSLVQNTTDPLYQSKTSTAVIDSPNWVNASRAIVAYYMDPRNMMSEDSVFQFLDLSYTADSIDETHIDNALSGSFMASPNTALYAPTDPALYYKQIFAMAGNESGINPIFLVSHAIQECGSRGSSSSNGTDGVYNFFNIGAYSNVINASRVGLSFAKLGLDAEFNSYYQIPWDTPGKSIINGARWIANNYTNCGQNTVYFFRFNFNPQSTNTVGNHQYFTATQSVNAEGRRIYSVYEASGNIDSALHFYIPVYKNMPDSPSPLPTNENVYSEFVIREYQTIFGRTPSSQEISSWSSSMVNGTSASSMLSTMLQSSEFTSKSLSNEQFIDIAAKAALGRAPKSSEQSYARSLIEQCYGRMKIYEYFVNLAACKTFFGHYGVPYQAFTDTDIIDSNIQIKSFVDMLYEGVFHRKADTEGTRYWIGQLASGSMSGTEVAAFFFTSEEFINGGYSNTELINRLYDICFDRTPDTSGFNYWNDLLSRSYSREYVIAGIINSPEFSTVCGSYGVTPGVYKSGTTYQYCPNTEAVNSFVTRLYDYCFNRAPDASGFSYWTGRLMTVENGINSITGYEIARDFVFSAEMNSLNLSNEEFVRRMYVVLLDREPDPDGFNYWVSGLNRGDSRSLIFEGFSYSEEYQNLCMRSGICPNSNFC